MIKETTTRMTFLGAAGTVTGSKYLLEHRDQHVLIDCGLFQGYKQLRLHNRLPFQTCRSTSTAPWQRMSHACISAFAVSIGCRSRTAKACAKAHILCGRLVTVPVRAEVVPMDTLSAHADADEIIQWLCGFKRAPKQIKPASLR
jgi:Cft2 family RNA processing exonuclease